MCLMLVNAWTALFFTAQNVQTLLAAEILCGIVCDSFLSPRDWSSGSLTAMFTALGRLPNPHHHIRLRGLPHGHARLSDHLRQFLLGCRPAHRNWRHHVHAESRRRVGLPNSLCPPMDLAFPACHWHRPGSRVPLVACSDGEAGQGEGRSPTPDKLEQGHGLRCRRDGRHDGAHDGAGGKNHERCQLLGLFQGP